MSLISEIIVMSGIFLQYLISFYSIYFKKFNLFAITYLVSIFFYDFLFINAYYFLPPMLLAMLKPFNEYLFVILFLRFIITIVQQIKTKDRIIDRLLLIIVVPSLIVLCINDFGKTFSPKDIIAGIRIYLLPILIPYLMYKANWLESIDKRKLLLALFITSIIAVVYGIFQKIGFNGDVRSLWFYNFFNQYEENPVEIGPYNFIRNDVLRTTSFFVSPIIYSIAIAVPTIYIQQLLLSKNKVFSKWFLISCLCIFVYGLIIAETRVGLIISFIGLGVNLVPKFFSLKYSYRLMLFIPILAVILTIISLIGGYTDDLSALGRIIQYRSFFDYFKPLGLGFSSEFVLTKFDTYYMSIGLVYGLFVVFPAWFYLKLNKTLYKIVLSSNYNEIVFDKATLALSLTFVYSFAFQFTAGAYQYRVLFFLIFITLSNYIKHGKES